MVEYQNTLHFFVELKICVFSSEPKRNQNEREYNDQKTNLKAEQRYKNVQREFYENKS